MQVQALLKIPEMDGSERVKQTFSRADSPHMGETSSDMFFIQEEVNVCVLCL